MAKTREIKRRLHSIDKIRQITRTMEMVATSKLKKATDRVAAGRTYADRLADVIARLTDPELRTRYPLLRQPESERRVAVVLLTSNRGLAGAFNINLIREARQLRDRLEGEGTQVELHVVGRKGIAFFRFRKVPMATQRTDISDRPTTDDAASLIDDLCTEFEQKRLDAVYVVYAQFRSPVSTPPRVMKVLPVEAKESEGRRELDYILSPGPDEILNRLLPLYVRNRVYRALVETAASEQGARRTAMKNATDNAGEMLDNLRRSFNRARQAQITQEIAEIVGGAAALE
ncbi:MAG TPA: ATP synthase F1 subunit gamma [Longimicrobiales bacterium]|nr:ATP synthase F1 subunit gamma [Longimicrobiales bacterium]